MRKESNGLNPLETDQRRHIQHQVQLSSPYTSIVPWVILTHTDIAPRSLSLPLSHARSLSLSFSLSFLYLFTSSSFLNHSLTQSTVYNPRQPYRPTPTHVNQGADLPTDFLDGLYASIKAEKVRRCYKTTRAGATSVQSALSLLRSPLAPLSPPPLPLPLPPLPHHLSPTSLPSFRPSPTSHPPLFPSLSRVSRVLPVDRHE